MILWKIYFYAMIIFVLQLLWLQLPDFKLITLINTLTNIITLIALYGFCYNKKLVVQKFGQISFITFVLYEIDSDISLNVRILRVEISSYQLNLFKSYFPEIKMEPFLE